MICLPQAGGAGYSFGGLRPGPAVQLRAVDYPGHLTSLDLPLCRTMPDLVDRLADDIRPLPAETFVLLGVSMGAVVAYELARRFAAAGTPAAALVAVSCPAPDRLVRLPSSDLDDAALLAALDRRYGTGSGTALSHPELRRLVLPALRADVEILEHYTAPGTILPTPIVAVVGRDDPGVGAEDARGWRELTSDCSELLATDGGHLLQQDAPQVLDAVLDQLARRLVPLGETGRGAH